MGMWTNKDHRTIADDTDDFAHGPSGGPLKKWLAGIVVAGAIIIFGVAGLRSGEAILFSSRNSDLYVAGPGATALNSAYIALGMFVHFHYFWGLDGSLWRFSQALKTVSLIVFLPCFLYGLWLAFNFASWI
jgi:hypothetical protein